MKEVVFLIPDPTPKRPYNAAKASKAWVKALCDTLGGCTIGDTAVHGYYLNENDEVEKDVSTEFIAACYPNSGYVEVEELAAMARELFNQESIYVRYRPGSAEVL